MNQPFPQPMAVVPPLYTLKVSSRPPRTWGQILNAIACWSTFTIACITLNACQFLFLFLSFLLPFPWATRLYKRGIRYTKGCFGCLTVLTVQWFAPTELIITFESKGQGRLTEEDIDRIVVRDEGSGGAVGLNLPSKSIMIANHQVYADWWYAWCLTYFMGTHKDVFIALKKSLKWVPLLGWGMQFFDFIFLARSWASDQWYLASRLASLGKQAEQNDNPLTLMLFPEGTLVSGDTRPISKKYADKMGISDLRYMLLPRSTGLHHSLRSLLPHIPKLKLIDITIAYPGVPPMEYGQNYYTLRSIFLDRVPPPAMHMHIRLFHVAQQVPIGDLSLADPQSVPKDSSEKEKTEFDLWLRKLWEDKDQLMSDFHQNGSFSSNLDPKSTTVRIPLRLRHAREYFDSFSFFLPFVIVYVLVLFRQSFT